MKYIRIIPHDNLKHLIECYWIVESDDTTTKVEKIIPDGFTELIFHYGDPYRKKVNDEWQSQALNLLCGQISSYFYLENTGRSGIIAVKFMPTGLTQLFDLDMSVYKDKIVDADIVQVKYLSGLREKIIPFKDEDSVKIILDDYFIALAQSAQDSPVTDAIDLIFKTNGMVSVKEMAEAAGVGERHLERLFKKFVGLSPKYYGRIIRFNYIFQLIQAKKTPWADIVFQAGYYDQSHFIRNFKAFTGEDPSAYFFEEENMANFFLNK
jgi:AraC-like DNA-binding protein